MEVKSHKRSDVFIALSPTARALLLGYLVVYVIYQPAVLTYYSYGYDWLMYFMDTINELLIFLPIIFYRKQFGWLHPLIFPLVFSLARQIGANPELLFGIFYPEQLSEYMSLSHILFYDWRQSDLNFAYIWGRMLNIIALSFYYLAFFYSKPKVWKLKFKTPSQLKSKVFIIIAISFIVFVAYMIAQGGVSSHLLSWAQGRFNALAGDGPIFVLVKMAPFSVLIWYAFDRQTERNPIFWLALLTSTPLQFLLTGSRSSIVYLGTLFILITIWKRGQIPKFRIVIFGILAIILIGLLGNIRSSTFKGSIEWESFVNVSVFELVEDTQEEIKRRNESNGYLAVIATVPDEVDYLYGESYIGTVLFFVPRFIWPSKPRGAGALAGERIFNKSSGAGVPPGPVGEAYWNFSIFGVVLIFALYGYFHKWLAVNYQQYNNSAGYFIFYIITLTIFSPTGIAMVSYFHAIIPVFLILKWMKVL